MENQREKNTEDQMEAGIAWWFRRIKLPQKWVVHFGVAHRKDYSILESILGFPFSGNVI